MSISRSSLVAVALLVMAIAGGCPSSDPQVPQRPSGSSVGADRSLIVLRRGALVGVDVASGEERRLGRVPTPDVFPIPGSSDRFLLVADPHGGVEFAADPRLVVIDEKGRRIRSLGAGYSPLVDPSGERIAFLRASGNRVCEGEVCLGSVVALVADIRGRARPLLPPGDWHLISWAGDSVIVTTRGKTFRVSTEGELEKLPVFAGDVWGGTPDGESLILAGRGGVELMDLDSGERRSTEVSATLAEGEWDPAGRELMAVAVSAKKTSLVRMTTDGTATAVPDSRGAGGPILWGTDGSFAFTRADGLRLQAVVCEDDDACRTVLEWSEGVVPLALR